MSGLCVSVAKNSTKLLRLLLSVRVNSSTQLEIAKIIKQSPELKILKSLSTRLAFQHLGLIKNIANWWYFDPVVFPNKPLLFAVIPEALLAIQSLAQKRHEIAVYLTTGTLEGDIDRERVSERMQEKMGDSSRSASHRASASQECLVDPTINHGALSLPEPDLRNRAGFFILTTNVQYLSTSYEACPISCGNFQTHFLKSNIVTLQGKSKQLASTYYPYFTYENVRSRPMCL